MNLIDMVGYITKLTNQSYQFGLLSIVKLDKICLLPYIKWGWWYQLSLNLVAMFCNV